MIILAPRVAHEALLEPQLSLVVAHLEWTEQCLEWELTELCETLIKN